MGGGVGSENWDWRGQQVRAGSVLSATIRSWALSSGHRKALEGWWVEKWHGQILILEVSPWLQCWEEFHEAILEAESWVTRIFLQSRGEICACSVAQSCLTLCDPLDCSPPCSSVHGILQARVLEWVAISSSRGSSQPRDQNSISYVFCICRQVLYH